MSTITTESANEYIQRFFEEPQQEQTSNPKPSIPWQEKPPSSWAEFLTLMSGFCEYRGWELIFDSKEDMSLAIFAHDEKGTNGAEALQGCLPVEEDSLPF